MIACFYEKFPKNSIFIPANKYEEYIVSKDYFIAHHDDKTALYPIGDTALFQQALLKSLIRKLGAFPLKYQYVGCLYTLFKFRFSHKIVSKSRRVSDIAHRAVDFNQESRGMDRNPIMAKERLLRKKYKKHLLSAF